MNTEELRTDIASRFERHTPLKRLGRMIASCRSGDCGRCGDACPIRAKTWQAANLPLVAKLFALGTGSASHFRLSCSSWEQEAGDLSKTGLQAVFKTTRRILDSLNNPALVAFGLVEARWGYQKWEISITVFVGGSSRQKLRRAFDHTRNIVGPLTVDAISEISGALDTLLREGQQAKAVQPRQDDVGLTPARRGEYYAWLARIKPSGRIFRYGCDRYFNQLAKTARPTPTLKPRKPRPYPVWLEPSMYGSHPMTCKCNICANQGNR